MAKASKKRYCNYYGAYFCKSCHKGDKMVIPALLVKRWDRSKYEVCRDARNFLRENMEKPIIDLTAANPGLYAEVPALQSAHDVRIRFSMMKDYIHHCPDTDELLRKLDDRRYYMDNVELYALRDLIRISEKGEKFVKELEATCTSYTKHISEECTVSRPSSRPRYSSRVSSIVDLV